nr:MBL fold metallo-hydrolase [Pelagivirga sediminicola]
MTYKGTNTYLIGQTDLAVIDPGPESPAHLATILAAVEPGQRISHILITHAHLDHSALARPLAAATGAPVLAYGSATCGRSAMMERLAAGGGIQGGEGVDTRFRPDRCLADGDVVTGADWQIEALWTPGHFGNHLCFAWQDTILSGDLVMGWSTSLVSPPDGDMSDFMASCRRLAARAPRTLHPGHGAPVGDPAARIAHLLAHRTAREAAILAALAEGPASAATLAAYLYRDTPAVLMPAAARNVLAHLIDLTSKNRARPLGEPGAETAFERLGD